MGLLATTIITGSSVHGGVPEDLLDRYDVGAFVEEMGSTASSHVVGRAVGDVGLGLPAGEYPVNGSLR